MKQGIILFLGIGKDVKKVHYTGELSIPALRMLFIERFGYSSGLSDFPSIYIKDPVTNISYELEDLEDVKNNSVLSLNIDGMLIVYNFANYRLMCVFGRCQG